MNELRTQFVSFAGCSESRYHANTEAALLWRVAALGPELEPVRRTLIVRCYQDPQLRERLLEGNHRSLRAVIGLCPRRHALSRQQASHLNRRMR